jgi:paraquat-inducible protein B
MAKQANRMMIGGFVVLAVAILAASLVVFGSGKFFKKTNKYVLFFDESIKGLNVGAPVLFQGVPVGSVTNIVILADFKTLKADIPVFIEIEPDRFQVSARQDNQRDPKKVADKLIKAGLRAMLTMQSFITGQLLIELDFFPNTPVVLRNLEKDEIEFPTIPSTSARLARALDNFDFRTLETKLQTSLDGFSKIVNDPDVTAAIRDLKETLQSARKLITKVDKQVDPLAKDMKKLTTNYDKLAREVDSKIKGLSASLEKTLSGFDQTLSGVDKTLTSARGVMSPDAPLVVDMENTLKELSAVSRSVRELADYLDEHPESLIRGKKKPKGQ